MLAKSFSYDEAEAEELTESLFKETGCRAGLASRGCRGTSRSGRCRGRRRGRLGARDGRLGHGRLGDGRLGRGRLGHRWLGWWLGRGRLRPGSLGVRSP